MAKAEIQEVVSADRDKLFQAICKYEDYPQFVEGCEAVKVERKGAGQARATYRVNMIKLVNYTLDHRENPEAGTVEWNLVESDSFKLNNGRWELKSVGPGKTEVKYSLEVEFNFPVPGFMLNPLIKGSLPNMVKNFVKRANNG